jgi:diacylglycerol kinase family enzyme
MRGRHPERADVIHQSGTEVTISGTPFDANADGELSGPIRRRTWRVEPGAWRLVLPEPAA